MPGAKPDTLRETTLPALLLGGDLVVAFAGLSLGWWLRYHSALGLFGLDVPDARFAAYLPLVIMGVIFLVVAFAQQGLYDGRMLLRKQQCLNLLARGTVFWVIVYLAFSLVIKFDPPVHHIWDTENRMPVGFISVALNRRAISNVRHDVAEGYHVEAMAEASICDEQRL